MRKQTTTAARVTEYVNADNQLRYSVSVVGHGMVPAADEGTILGNFTNAAEARTCAANYNNQEQAAA